ncbi:MAG: hypothetical protein EOO16_00525 [Chitinophagaceae bacterium]|nr:MAG: hypothetical protein EOO16_00525 [Chitinophagaceae bacterium]
MKPTFFIAGFVLALAIGGIFCFNSASTPSRYSEGTTTQPSGTLLAGLSRETATPKACCPNCPGPCPAAQAAPVSDPIPPPPLNARSGR